MSFSLSSSSFSQGDKIPKDYAFGTFDAVSNVALSANKNPHLAWSAAPKGTRSFALLCVDDKVPSKPDDVNQAGRVVPADLPRVDFFHWVVANIPPQTTEIPAGSVCDGVTPRGKAVGQTELGLVGKNDYTAWFAGDTDMEGVYGGYDGPCPPWNDSVIHRYTFTVYALDITKVELKEEFGGPELREAIADHILAESSLVGTYTINPEAR